MVTHNEAIAQTCDRVIHIEDGQIVTEKKRFPKKENEIAADGFVLSNLGFSGNLGDSLRIGEKK